LDRFALSLEPFLASEDDPTTNEILPDHFSTGGRAIRAVNAGTRFPSRWYLRAGRALHTYLLPALVPGAAAAAAQRHVLPYPGRSGKAGVPALPAVPPE